MPRTIDNWRGDARSLRNLQGVHDDLVRVIVAAHAATLARHDALSFIVIEGLRTPRRQVELKAAGASMTLNSRHLTGHAVDLMAKVRGRGRWDWPLYATLGALVKAEAARLGVPLVWGGDWRRLRDGPHFELDRRAYP
jgi:peptidoglycan L-alanyl-D-glutamate endopeptidase CwlK